MKPHAGSWQTAALAVMLSTLLLSGTGATAALRSTPEASAWITNGEVNAIVNTPGAVYLGGKFTQVGPYQGCGVPLDAATGRALTTFPKVDRYYNWGITACIRDHAGGWYIGGDFGRVGGQARSGIARILADGTVDSAFASTVNDSVFALALSPDGATVYLGGDFSMVNGEFRDFIAAVDATTGALKAWNPGANDRVSAIVVSSSGAIVYAGGYFTNIGGQPRNCLAALDADGNGAWPWDPNANGAVTGLVLPIDESIIYAFGSFTNVGGQNRYRLAALNTASNDATTWNPAPSDYVSALVMSADNSTVYVGGHFTTIGGATRNHLAALSSTTGLATAWDPDAGYNIYALALSPDGSTVYAGGAFRYIGGENRQRLAALSTATGLVTDWNPIASDTVGALAISADGNTVYAGGHFNIIGGCLRDGLAAIHPVSGQALDFNPSYDNPGGSDEIHALAVSPDHQTLYVGGNFPSMGREPRNYLAALDAATGAATTWDPDANGSVYSLALSADGNTLYAGGSFTTIGGQIRDRIAAMSTTTGLVTGWNPDADEDVYALALSPDGNTIYAAGAFDNLGGQTRNLIGAVDATSGLATAWNPNASGLIIHALLPSGDGSTIYVGGVFSIIGGESRDYIAALDAATGLATGWDPDANDRVLALALSADGNTVYAGGYFSNIGTKSRSKIAALYAADGQATDWDPEANDYIAALSLSSDDAMLFAGGYAHWYGDYWAGAAMIRPFVARFDDPDQLGVLVMAASPPGAGTTTPGVGTYGAPVGVPISIAATPADGYLFTHWTVAGPGALADSLSASTTLTLASAVTATVTANFAETTLLTMAASPADKGTIVPGAGVYTVAVGVPQAISAAPIVGWHFDTWSVDAGNAVLGNALDAETVITVTDNGGATATANFSINQYTVTFQTDGTPGAGIDGTLVQVVDHGCDAGTVTAQAPVGYVFLHWTLDGVAYSASAALQVMGVTRDMTLVAKFATEGNAATLTLAASAGGTTLPAPGPVTVAIGEGVSILATSDPTYEFFGWEVTAGNATLGDPLAAATVVTVTDAAGATVTARFGQYARLTVLPNPAEGGAVTPAEPITVTVGVPTDIVAIRAYGYGFQGWSVGDGDALIANPLSGDTVVTVTSANPATVFANFVPFDQLAVGSLFTVDADDLLLIGFTVKPKVYGLYDHPFSGKLGLKATVKVLTKDFGDLGAPTTILCEWTKKIKLYDPKAFKAAQAAGVSADLWANDSANQQLLPLALHVASKEVPGGDQSPYGVFLAAPEIITATVGAAEGVTLISLEGNWFGIKKPKVWREYEVDDGAGGVIIKQQKLKLLKPAAPDFLDSKGKCAYMNAATGKSKAIAVIPAKDPKGTLNDVVVVDSGVGMGIWRFIED